MFVHVKHLARPRSFDGSKTEAQPFRKWKFGCGNCVLVDSGFIAEMGAAEQSADPIFLAAGRRLAIK